jgi:hypothetical protein
MPGEEFEAVNPVRQACSTGKLVCQEGGKVNIAPVSMRN